MTDVFWYPASSLMLFSTWAVPGVSQTFLRMPHFGTAG
jgi:hypothetical protein